MINRIVIADLQEALTYQAAVCIIGPRQVGKTTIAQDIGDEVGAIYLDMESEADRLKLTNPSLYFESVEDRLVIIDEVHRMPNLFPELRGVIDRGRRKGKGIGRFLLLGSASLDLINQSGESLAGRIAYIEMTSLLATEIPNNDQSLQLLWLRGGFPQSYLARTPKLSLKMRQDYIRTYLERDVAAFGFKIPAQKLQKLWTMLAYQQGSILNSSDLGRSLELSTQTTNRYIDILADLLLVRKLPPYEANINKRLVKSPKVYIRDSGIVHALLQLESLDQLLSHHILGNSWEGFVIENIAAVVPWHTALCYYRTGGGAEIDLVITFPNQEIWTVEIKRSLKPKLSKGYYEALKDIKPNKAFIVTATNDSFPLDEQSQVIGLAALMELVSQQKGNPTISEV